jgi:hypothetical protein
MPSSSCRAVIGLSSMGIIAREVFGVALYAEYKAAGPGDEVLTLYWSLRNPGSVLGDVRPCGAGAVIDFCTDG